MKSVECIANISEGKDLNIIKTTAEAAERGGASILDIDSGRGAGRTVITFAAPLEAMQEAAFQFIAKAVELIDMQKHCGVHPCIGAADVVPFVALGETTQAECESLARGVAQEVGEKLQVPTFLYGRLASNPKQAKLSVIRQGGYLGLLEHLKNGELIPDFGSTNVTSAGGVIIGVRQPMLAYNINLIDDNVSLANIIAAKIRTSGTVKRTPDGKIMRDEGGNAVREAGLFPNCEAIGWYIEDFNRAQVSTNIRSLVQPPIYEVYEIVSDLAHELGSSVTGSEIIGLIPKESLLSANKYYSNGAAPDDDFSAAIAGLGLNDVKAFDPKLKILEERLKAFDLI